MSREQGMIHGKHTQYILCLGDSITYGTGGTNAGFRGPLWTLLDTEDIFYGLIGPSILNPGSLSAGQLGHAGYPSYSSRDLARNLVGLDDYIFVTYGEASRDPGAGYWLSSSKVLKQVKFVFVLAGTNDIGFSITAREGFAPLSTQFPINFAELISTLNAQVPNAKILIGRVTPYTNKDSEVSVCNLVIDGYSGYENCTVVDLNTNFPNGETGDGVHPTDTGYTWMAQQWYNTIIS